MQENSIEKSSLQPPSVGLTAIGALVRAALNTAPFTGGVASLWSEWDSNRRFSRIEECLNETARTLKSMPNFLTGGTLNDAECHLIDEVIERVQREHRQEKRLRFGRLLASSLTRMDAPFQERITFVRALDEFDDLHISTLRALSEISAQEQFALFPDLGNVVLGEQLKVEEMESNLVQVLNTLGSV